MRPAFSSVRQAVGFAGLMLMVLALPALLGGSRLPPRQELYDFASWRWGPYPWDRTQIFDETNAADIIFLGSSHMAADIDTPYVQQQLTAHLGRPAVVRSVTWSGADFDVLYLVAKDLLAHRRVRMLVIYDESEGQVRNSQVPLLFRWGEEYGTVAGLPVRDRLAYYFAAVVGMPRNLLCWLRPNIPADLTQENWYMDYYHTPNPALQLGASTRHRGYAPMGLPPAPFVEYMPAAGMEDVCVYSPATKARFEFMNGPMPTWQAVFARRFARLAQAQGCQLTLLHLPVLAETNVAKITEKEYWPDFLQTDVAMAGVPPARFFAGLTPEQCQRLFADQTHMNANGQRYFSRLMTPALLEIYDANAVH